MVQKIRAKTEYRLTRRGRFGVLIVFASPLGTALFWWLYLEQIEKNAATRLSFERTDPTIFSILAALCGLAFMAGWLMVFLGRTMHHTILIDN